MKKNDPKIRCKEHDLPTSTRWHGVWGYVWKCKNGCLHPFGKSKWATWMTAEQAQQETSGGKDG